MKVSIQIILILSTFFTAEDEDMFAQSSDKDETVSAYRDLLKGKCTVIRTVPSLM